MSKERSPRELCSTTIGTRGISCSLSIRGYRPWRASLLRTVGGSEGLLADLEAHPRRAATLECVAQDREVPEQAMAAVVGAVQVQRVERLAARLRRQMRHHEQVARDDRMLARVDIARVQLVQLGRDEGVQH